MYLEKKLQLMKEEKFLSPKEKLSVNVCIFKILIFLEHNNFYLAH